MAAGKKVTDSVVIGDSGIALIHTIVGKMRHVWRAWDGSTDVGIDGSIELRDPSTGEASSKHLLVQSKASDRPFPSETDEKFHYICKERDVDYWMKADVPVLLVCSHPDVGGAWWVNVSAWFADPRHRASLRVDFNKATDAFDANSSTSLFAVADPYGRAHTPVPVALPETLTSNLLPVDMPDVYYAAATSMYKTGDAYAAQRKTKHPTRSDFVLANKRIYAWRPLSGTSLANVPDASANTYPVAELAHGTPDQRWLLVRLLNAALRDDLGDADFRWNHGRKFLHYRDTVDKAQKKVLSTTGHSRTVFKAHLNKKDPTKIAYYRHSALRWHFVDFDGDWYCAITPDYFFSHDGITESRYADDYLRGIKKLDRNQAVLGETRAWAAVLRTEENLLSDRDRILDFGDLVGIRVDKGISDASWKPATATSVTEPAEQDRLFDEPGDLL